MWYCLVYQTLLHTMVRSLVFLYLVVLSGFFFFFREKLPNFAEQCLPHLRLTIILGLSIKMPTLSLPRGCGVLLASDMLPPWTENLR